MYEGSLEVICGPMFSSKTEGLISRLRRAGYARIPVLSLKPCIDARYAVNEIVSHSNQSFKTTPVKDSVEVAEHIQKYCELYTNGFIVGIDEVQMFDDGIVPVILSAINNDVTVVVSGLDLDYQNKPFSVMSALLAHADSFIKLNAVCMKCGGSGTKTYRKNSSTERIVVGGADMYEARCLACFSEKD